MVDNLIFPAPSPSYKVSEFTNDPFDPDDEKLIWIKNATKHDVPAIFIQSLVETKKFVIYLHGNGCDIGQMIPELKYYRSQWKVNLLALEYDSYGLCPGSASETSVDQNVQIGYDFLRTEVECQHSDIIFFGRSIGTGPSVSLSAKLCGKDEPPLAVILQSPYLSVKHIVKDFGALATFGSTFIFNRWNSGNAIKKVNCPIIFIHGEDDTLISCDHSRQLYDSCISEIKRLHILPNTDHNLFRLEDVSSTVYEFLDLYGILENEKYQDEHKTENENLTIPIQFFEAPENHEEFYEKNLENHTKKMDKLSTLANSFQKTANFFTKSNNNEGRN